jgi:abortive infection bacteriophage resistance protein
MSRILSPEVAAAEEVVAQKLGEWSQHFQALRTKSRDLMVRRYGLRDVLFFFWILL